MDTIINRVIKYKHIEYVLIALIVIMAFFVRLYKIGSLIADWHSWRQADTASVTRNFVDKGINVLVPTYQDISSIQTGYYNPQGLRLVEFPVYNAIHALLTTSFPIFNLEKWGRLLSVFCSLVSTFVIYLLGKRLYGKWVGVLSAFFFAFIPFNIYFSRVILPEPMSVMFGLLSLWLFVVYYQNEKVVPLFLSGIFLALALLIKPFFFFWGVPLLYLAINKYTFKGIFKRKELLIFLDLAAVPFFFWRAWINQHPEGIPHFTWAFNGDSIRFRPSFWFWIFGERIGKLILGVWGLIPFSFGLIQKNKKNLFSLYFFLGSLLYLTVVATASVRHDYYQVLVIPSICLLLAQGIEAFWNLKNNFIDNLLVRPLILFSVFVMFVVGGIQVKEYYKINHPEIIKAGQAIDKIASKDALVVAPYNGDTAFLYQTKRAGWPVMEESFDEVIEKGADYFVTVNFGDPDTAYVMKNFKVLEKTNEYMIADLQQRIKP
jgi:hypothetical protein